MNRRIAFPILMLLLVTAFSCKSESKSAIAKSDEAKHEVESTELAQGQASINVDKNAGEKKLENEVDPIRKANDNDSAKVQNEEIKEEKPTTNKKKKKANIDPGIEIEMGSDIEESEKEKQVEKVDKVDKEVKDAKPIQEEKPEKEVDTQRPEKPERIETFVGFPSHSKFDALLKAHVSTSGAVDYKSLKAKESALDEYLKILENNPPGTTWNRDQKLAFWINAYNAFTIKLILKNYPLKSITSLHGGKPWDVKWIKIGDQNLSLNNIENDIIRPKFNEPRIHFAVNCAAVSCPPILNAAYGAKTLNQQLESQTKNFINNSKYNTLGKNEIEVSKIFEWYGEDFGNIASYVMQYADTTVKPSAKVSFKAYDWKLNGN